MRRYAALSTLAVLAALSAGVPTLATSPAGAAVLPERPLSAAPPGGVVGHPDVAGIGAWFEPTDLAGPATSRFIAKVAGGTVGVRRDGLRLDLPGAQAASVGVRFVDSGGSTPVGRRMSPTKVSYLIGNDPAAWRTSIPTYGRVTYGDVWPGVDLDYDLNAGRLKGTWRLAAGVPVSRVRWTYDGASVAVSDGQLVVTPTTPGAPRITERPPVAWQDGPDGQTPVECAYLVEPSATAGFACGTYDELRPLVIDPDVEWSVSHADLRAGEGGGTSIFDVAGSPDGSVVAGGGVSQTSREVPWQAEGVQRQYGGGVYDGWLARWMPDGRLSRVTFLGNESSEVVHRIAVDKSGRVGFQVRTVGSTFPGPTGPATRVQTSAVANRIVIGVLTPNLDSWVYTTFLNQPTNDYAAGIAFASNGDVVATAKAAGDGATPEDERPTPSAGAVSAVVPHAYVTRLDAAGTQRWTATLGRDSTAAESADGNGLYVNVAALALDAADDVYVVGDTDSDAFVGTAGVVQPKRAGGRDGFVLRLSSDGTTLRWRTLYGGSGRDGFTRVAVDPWGTVIAFGTTDSVDFGTRADCARLGATDFALLALAADARQVGYARCLGGTGAEMAGSPNINSAGVGGGLVVDASGSAYVMGETASLDFPVVRPWQAQLGGLSDVALAKIGPTGQVMWASYHGGPGRDDGQRGGIGLGSGGGVFFGGNTESGPTFPGSRPTDPIPPGGQTFVSLVRQDADDLAVPSAEPSASKSPSSDAGPSASTSPSSDAGPSASTSPSSSAGPSASTSPSSDAGPSASTSPSSSGSPSSGASPSVSTEAQGQGAAERPSSPASSSCVAGRLSALEPAIVAGQRVRVRYIGSPGESVYVDGYSRRRHEQPTYRSVRPAVMVPASGVVDYTFAPTTHTRLRAVGACGMSDSIVIRVAPAVTMTAWRLGRLTYRLSGRVLPAAATQGAGIVVSYRAVDGRQVRKAVTRSISGAWSVDVRFTTPARVVLRASLASSAWHDAGRTGDVVMSAR